MGMWVSGTRAIRRKKAMVWVIDTLVCLREWKISLAQFASNTLILCILQYEIITLYAFLNYRLMEVVGSFADEGFLTKAFRDNKQGCNYTTAIYW